MASENVELVRLIWTAWERGDYGSAEWAHPQIEFAFPDGPDPTNVEDGRVTRTEIYPSPERALEAAGLSE
jgi:hypothetical protein